MLHFRYTAFITLCLTILSSCDDHMGGWCHDKGNNFLPSTEHIQLAVSHNDFDFDSSGGTLSNERITASQDWSFIDVPDWLSISPLSGTGNSEFSLTVGEHNVISSRYAVFFIESQGKDLTVQRRMDVLQLGVNPYISFPESTKTVSGAAQTISITVDTNIDDAAFTVSHDEYPWVNDITYSNKILGISIDANSTTKSRSITIYLTSDFHNRSSYITITQLPANFDVGESTTIEFDADGGNKTIEINSDLPWRAETYATWVIIDPSSGDGGETDNVTISTTPSYQTTSRSTNILFFYKDSSTQTDYITIKQTGRYLKVKPDDITISAEGTANNDILIDSNIGWEISSKPDWIVFETLEGSAGESSVSISAIKNNSLTARSGVIRIQDKKGIGLKSTINVTQSGLDFSDMPTLEFNWHASSQPLILSFPGYWNAAVSAGWITLSEYQGTGESEITVSATCNESETERTGSIIFTSEDKSFTVNVVQAGQYIHIDSESGTFNAMGGSLELSVSSSMSTEWSVIYPTETNGWVNIDNSNESTYRITVDYNPSINEREAEFVLQPTDDDASAKYQQGVKYHIKQSGRLLTCNVSELNIFSTGGTSEIYEINSDGPYTISKDAADTWYTLIHKADSNTFYIVTTENSTDQKRTGKISVSLAELPENESFTHEIKILQYGTGINTSFEDYEDEEIW